MDCMGYRRPDGKFGARNHVLVMPGVLCCSKAAEKIAAAVPGAKYLYNPAGCGQCEEDTARSLEVLSGLLANPNVYAALIVGLGCEHIKKDDYLGAVRRKAPWKRVEYLCLQEEGGMRSTVERGIAVARELAAKASACERTPAPLSELCLAVECGGSDATSGLSANTVLGCVSDMIADAGGTVVISETSEAIGAEHILRARAADPETGEAIYNAIRAKDESYRAFGEDIRNSNPTPGNKAGGITTLEEKSMGCIQKCGTRPITGFLRQGEQISRKGTLFMDSGAMDPVSVNAKLAGGCQVLVFTTGRGNPCGSAAAPVIKITGNRETYEKLPDILDFDTSATLTGEKSIRETAKELLSLSLETASGRLCLAEENDTDVMAIEQRHPGN